MEHLMVSDGNRPRFTDNFTFHRSTSQGWERWATAHGERLVCFYVFEDFELFFAAAYYLSLLIWGYFCDEVQREAPQLKVDL